MRDISFNAADAGFNDTIPLQETHNPAGSAATPSPQTLQDQQRLPTTMSSMQVELLRQLETRTADQPRKGDAQQTATVNSPALSMAKLNTMLAKAFDAQRLEINTQAGPSTSPHLSALDKLQQRHFKPAFGGLDIPFTPHSLLGGGKRVSQRGTSSRNIPVVPIGAARGLRQEISDKQELINTLTAELVNAQEEENPDDIAIATQSLAEARAELFTLAQRLILLSDERNRMNG